MGQIKYLLSAVLIFLGTAAGIVLSNLLTSATWVLPPREMPEAFCGNGDTPLDAGAGSAGRQIFQQNCASCHALDKVLSGPALRGVMTRGPWMEDSVNFSRWVRNPAAFIPTTSYTQKLQQQFGAVMPSFPQLTDDEISSLHRYLSVHPNR